MLKCAVLVDPPSEDEWQDTGEVWGATANLNPQIVVIFKVKFAMNPHRYASLPGLLILSPNAKRQMQEEERQQTRFRRNHHLRTVKELE